MKRIKTWQAIAVTLALTGCHTCWRDRVDQRPPCDASVIDKLSYWVSGPFGNYRPCYHCGAADGLLDRKAVRHAAIDSANQTLNEQFPDGTSRDFQLGFQQAFLDIANGGSGALPAIPPTRYWRAAYRTTWGHRKAGDWFAGYQAGAQTAKCGALSEAQTIPTSVCLGPDRSLTSMPMAAPGGVVTAPAMSLPPAQPMLPAPLIPYGPTMPTPGWNQPLNQDIAAPSQTSAGNFARDAAPLMSFPNSGPSGWQPSWDPRWLGARNQIPGPLPPVPLQSPVPNWLPATDAGVPPTSLYGHSAASGMVSFPEMGVPPSPAPEAGHSIAPGSSPSLRMPLPSQPQIAPNSWPSQNPWKRFMGFDAGGIGTEGAAR